MASDHPPATHEPDRPDHPPPAPPPPPDTGPEPTQPGMPPKPDDKPGGMIGEGGDPTEVTPDPGMLSEG